MHMRATIRSFSKIFLLPAFVVCGAAACQDNAEHCNEDLQGIATSDVNWVVEQCGTYVHFWPYTPEPIQNLDDLPTEIRERVDRHLTNRFGTSYYSNLSFIRGSYVDKAELYRVEPSAKDYKWTVYSYRLLYRFSDESKGVKAYTANIQLDHSGEVVREIGLPPTRQFPKKDKLISTLEAYAIASRVPTYSAFGEIDNPGFREELRIWYLPDVGSLIYRFQKMVPDGGGHYDYQFVDIDAHSGEVYSEGPNY